MKLELILGNQAYSSWSLRGWLLLRAFDIAFSHRVIPLRTAAFDAYEQDCFPVRTVPALEIETEKGSELVWDSLAIAESLYELFPQAGIWPADGGKRRMARSLAAEMHSGFLALRATMPMNVRRRYSKFVPVAEAQQDIDRIADLWRWALEKQTSGGGYLMGEAFCAADAFFVPVASRFYTYGVRLDDRLQAYADRLLAHPAVVEFVEAGLEESWVMPENEFDCG